MPERAPNSPTVASITSRSAEGQYEVVVTDDTGAEHVFRTGLDGIELVELFQDAVNQVEIDDAGMTALAAKVFETIIESISDWTLYDPQLQEFPGQAGREDPNCAVEVSDVFALRISVTDYDYDYDNGWFPHGQVPLFLENGRQVLQTRDPRTYPDPVDIVADGDLETELKELGGEYRHDRNWTLVITRDGQYGTFEGSSPLLQRFEIQYD